MRSPIKKIKTALAIKQNANKHQAEQASDIQEYQEELEELSMHDMWQKLHKQTKEINKQLTMLNNHKLVHTYNSLPRFIWFSFLKGIAVGLGSVLGATVVLSFLVYVLSQMEFIPIIGEWVTAILEVVKSANPN